MPKLAAARFLSSFPGFDVATLRKFSKFSERKQFLPSAEAAAEGRAAARAGTSAEAGAGRTKTWTSVRSAAVRAGMRSETLVVARDEF